MTQKSAIIKELFQLPSQKFTEHLLLEDNERIIFSGKFGMGKTTFLRNHFFKEETLTTLSLDKRYNLIHLFPVNYSVSQNEDIFRYIKYDILLELLRNKVNVESINLSFSDTLPAFIEKNILEIATAILHMIPAVGKNITGIADGLKALWEKFKIHHNSYREQANDADILTRFLEELENSEGSIYEHDVVTKIIEQVLLKWKENNESGSADSFPKENVLIIDDLDRIDPDHIFRILNIFAAHFDSRDERPNKFGFDKIILVCDISNIRQIFRAKFGLKVDFNGYIDKFYSHHIFEFNPYQELPEIAKKFVFNKLKILDRYGEEYILYSRNNDGRFLQRMLHYLVINNEIDLRNIIKLEKVRLNDLWNVRINHVLLPDDLEAFTFSIKLLVFIKGDAQSLVEALDNNVTIEGMDSIDKEQYIGTCIFLMTYSSQNVERENPTNHYFSRRTGTNLSVEKQKNSAKKFNIKEEIVDQDNLFRQILIETVLFLKSNGVL